MPEYPLYVAIVWHMHQPYYRDMRTGEIRLPWVRLHAAKDYLHMGEVLARYPGVHLTVNMVPSLTDQMLAWAEGRESDRLAQLAEQTTWTLAEKRLILNLCYSISWNNIIRRYPRYSELLDRRPEALANPSAFTTGDYRDLITWFNLAWIDPNWLENDRVLARLVAKRHGYTIEDLRAVHDRQRHIAASVLPLYQRLASAGQLEVSTTPYFHPILPLLIDTGEARRPSPGLPLPAPGYRAAEDAAAQLRSAVLAHTRHFGAAPRGLWPAEGAVSFELLPFVTAAGFNWLASDEAILARSLGRPFSRDGSGLIEQPRQLYQPYRVMAGPDLGPSIIFRDHELADRIGFLYQRLPGPQAAEDMIYRLLEVRNRLNDREHPYLVSIILDGENCWEHYEHNGDPFLHAFYAMLQERRERNELAAVTVGEYLDAHRSGGTLARLATGSWIGGDLTTWIGDPEHNRAWEALARTRAHLLRHSPDCAPALDVAAVAASGSPETPAPRPAQPTPGDAEPDLAAAWKALYAAEGSDWFWWYSHRNRSDQDAIFDQLFRNDLAAVYQALGHDVPDWLEQPINRGAARATTQAARAYVSPALTAGPFPGDAWAPAASLLPAEASTGTMQRAAGLIERLFLGHDRTSLYLRIDLRDDLASYTVALYLGATAGQAANQQTRDPGARGFALGWAVELPQGQGAPFLYRAAGQEQWQAVGPVSSAAGPRVLEVSLPLAPLGLQLGQEVSLMVTLAQHGAVCALLPEQGMTTFTLEQF